MNSSETTRLLDPREAAGVLGVTIETLGLWRRAGKLKYVRVGERFKYRRSDLEAYLADPPGSTYEGGPEADGGRFWRIGTKVPINVYDGDRPVCQCQTVMDARLIVAAVNEHLERLAEARKSVKTVPAGGDRPA